MKKLICVLLAAFGIGLSYLNAEEIDFGTYKVTLSEPEGWRPSICLPDGQVFIKGIFPQILLPEGSDAKRHIYENFNFEKPVIGKQNGLLVIDGKGLFKKSLSAGGINIEATMEMKYNLTFCPEGSVNLVYEFINNGDDILAEPYLNIRLNYDFLKNQQWDVKKTEGKEQQGVWPAEVVYGVNSLDCETGQPVELQILSAALNTSLGKPLICTPSEQSHLRISGDGVVTLYNFAHFTGEWSKYEWKTFKAKENYAIKTEITLPVEPGSLKTAL